MSETQNDNSTENTKNITIKKSTYNNLIKGIVATIVISAFVVGYSLGALDDTDSISVKDLKKILSEIDTVPVLQPTQMPTILPPQIIEIVLGDDPVKGNTDAPITLVEFSDFQCPFCFRFFQQTLPLIEENYINTGKIKLVYQDLPLDNIHSNARSSHIAAECADEQGKFWEYHDVLFANQGQWSNLSIDALDSQLKQYAATLELDSQSFESCLVSTEIANEIDEDLLQAAQYGATGTPTFFIGNQEKGFVKLVGAQPYTAFQNVIDSQLK